MEYQHGQNTVGSSRTTHETVNRIEELETYDGLPKRLRAKLGSMILDFSAGQIAGAVVDLRAQGFSAAEIESFILDVLEMEERDERMRTETDRRAGTGPWAPRFWPSERVVRRDRVRKRLLPRTVLRQKWLSLRGRAT